MCMCLSGKTQESRPFSVGPGQREALEDSGQERAEMLFFLIQVGLRASWLLQQLPDHREGRTQVKAEKSLPRRPLEGIHFHPERQPSAEHQC